jgi:hypothetical protein
VWWSRVGNERGRLKEVKVSSIYSFTTLLRCNSIKLPQVLPFKVYNSVVFSIFSYPIITLIDFKTFSSPQK